MSGLGRAATAAVLLLTSCQLPMMQQMNNKFDPASSAYVPPAAIVATGFTVVSGSVTASLAFPGTLGATSFNLYSSPTVLTSFAAGTKTAGVTSPATLTPAATGTANYVAITSVVKGVEAVTASTLTLTLGGAPGTATVTMLPGSAANGTVTWASSAPSVATVSAAGLVTGVATGNTTVTGTDGTGKTVAQATVKVGAYSAPQMPVYSYNGILPVSGYTYGWQSSSPVTGTNFVFAPGDTITVAVAGTASSGLPNLNASLVDTSNGGFNVTTPSYLLIASPISKNVDFASVQVATVVRAFSTTTGANLWVVASTSDVQTTTTTLTFTKLEFFKNLAAYTPSTGISVSPKTLTLVAGQATGSVTVSALPASATVQGAVWSSSNTSIATVDANGVVSPWSEGTATITATSPDGGWTDTSTITVTAPAGSNWTSATLPVAADWSHVAFGNGVFVALPDTGTSAAVSSDGTTWTATTLPVSGPWTNIAFGNGTFVVVKTSGTTALTSPNGVAWTQRTLTTSQAWSSVAFGAGRFVAVSSTNAADNYSPDGVSWTQGALPQPSTWMVQFAGGQFVVWSSNLSGVKVSSTGLNWTGQALPSIQNYSKLAYGNGLYVLQVAGATTAYVSSTDGVTWTSQTMPSSANWSDITFGSGAFVALESGSGQVMNSGNGLNWASRNLPSTHNWASVTFGNGKFVAVANDNTAAAATSP